MVIIAKIDNKKAKGRGEGMVRIEYDRLVAICYSIGVLLLLKIPNDNELIGEKLFNFYKIPVYTYTYMDYKSFKYINCFFRTTCNRIYIICKMASKKEI